VEGYGNSAEKCRKARRWNARRSNRRGIVAVTDLSTQHFDLAIHLADLLLGFQKLILQFLNPIGPSDELNPIPFYCHELKFYLPRSHNFAKRFVT
jgi:hypothetical protein